MCFIDQGECRFRTVPDLVVNIVAVAITPVLERRIQLVAKPLLEAFPLIR